MEVQGTSGYWRVMIEQGDFMRDTIKLHIGYRTQEGLRIAKPFVIELGEAIAPEVITPVEQEPTELPRELAELLTTHLGHMLIGSGDMVTTIRQLRSDLAKANKRVDDLISGIGQRQINPYRGLLPGVQDVNNNERE